MSETEPEVGETTLVERRVTIRPWWWLATAAFVFLALWGWRELGIRVAGERTASRDAEIRQLRADNQRLNAQVAKLEIELANAATIVSVQGLPKGSARVFLDSGGHGVVVTSDVPRGRYDLRLEGTPEPIATIDVPPSGERTAMINQTLDMKSARSFSLTRR